MAAKKKAKETANTLTIKTSKFQEMVSRAAKGIGNNKVYPISQMMAIKLESNVLTLVTTDATNYLYVKENKVDGEDFYAVVSADQFCKLVSKLTSESVTMELTNAALVIKGNGTYSVEIQFDDDGEMVRYPDPVSEAVFDPDDTVEINASTIATVLTSIKPALATTTENPCYTGYYVGDKVVATDTALINALDVEMFKAPKLVSPEVMDLLSVMQSEKIQVDFAGNIQVYSSPDCTIYGRDLEGIEDFSIDAVTTFLDMEMPSMCKLSKNALLQLLDRLSLFVTDYDENGIDLTFTKNGLQVSSKSSNGVEIIPYLESNDFAEFVGEIDVKMFQRQVKAQSGDAIEVWYGNEKAIKLVSGKVVQLIALNSEEPGEDGEDGE